MTEKMEHKRTGDKIYQYAGYIVNKIWMPDGEINKKPALNIVCIAEYKKQPGQKQQIGKHQFRETFPDQQKGKSQKNKHKAVACDRCPLFRILITLQVDIIKNHAVCSRQKKLKKNDVTEGHPQPVTEHPVSGQCKGNGIQEWKEKHHHCIKYFHHKSIPFLSRWNI